MAINKDSLITAGGSKFVNFTNGVMRITVVGENSTDKNVFGANGFSIPFVGDLSGEHSRGHKLDIFTAEVSIPDSGISIPLDTIMGRTRDINDLFNSKGSYAGSTMGNEQLTTSEMSLGFTEDYVYLSDNPSGHIVSRDILKSMLAAESFGFMDPADGKAKAIKVAGTNGAIKRDRMASSDRHFGGLFVNDGKLVVPQAGNNDGKPLLEPNARVVAYNTSALTVMVEVLYTFSETETNGFRFVYTLNGGFNYNEGDDVNKITCNSQVLCDARVIEDFWVNGDATNCLKTDSATLTPFLLSDAVEGGNVPYIDLVGAMAPVAEDGPNVVYINDGANGVSYMLLAGDVPVPAYLGENGANPDLCAMDTLISPDILNLNLFKFNIYDFDLVNATFKKHTK